MALLKSFRRLVAPENQGESMMLVSPAKPSKHTSHQQARDTNTPDQKYSHYREWQGIEHCVTVRDNDYEYQGRPYTSLSAIARAITGTRWNGWVFFGLKNRKGAA